MQGDIAMCGRDLTLNAPTLLRLAHVSRGAEHQQEHRENGATSLQKLCMAPGPVGNAHEVQCHCNAADHVQGQRAEGPHGEFLPAYRQMEAGRYGHDEPRESESAIQPGPEREVNPRERKAEQGQHGHRPQREVMAGQVFLHLQNAGEEQRAEPKMQAQQHLRELAGRPDGQAEVDEQTLRSEGGSTDSRRSATARPWEP